MNDKILCDVKMRKINYDSFRLDVHIECLDYDELLDHLYCYIQDYEIISIWINNYNIESGR